MVLDLFLALYLDFALECKSLSVGEFDELLFFLFACLSIPIFISDLSLTSYYFLKFTVWAKFVILFNLDFLIKFYYYFQGSFGILLILGFNSFSLEKLVLYLFSCNYVFNSILSPVSIPFCV